MALSLKTIAQAPVNLADLFTKCSELSKLEDKEIDKIVGTIVPVLSWLNAPVALHPGSLGGTFREVKEASLQSGAMVVMTDELGKSYSRALAKFSVEDCLAILQDCFPELQRLVADKRRAGQFKPELSVRMKLGGSRFILDMRSHRLIVSNSGSECRSLSVSGSYAGGKTKTLGPVDLVRGRQAELNFGVFKKIHLLSHIDFRIECKDADGLELRAAESIRIDGEEWQKVALAKA
jgi:hypothetical protein